MKCSECGDEIIDDECLCGIPADELSFMLKELPDGDDLPDEEEFADESGEDDDEF